MPNIDATGDLAAAQYECAARSQAGHVAVGWLVPHEVNE